MAAIIEFPYKVLKKMFVYEDSSDKRHNSSFCQALTCNEVREQDNLCPQIQPKYNTSCQPTTIVTRDGVRIPPASSEDLEMITDQTANCTSTQTTPKATRFTNYSPSYQNNNNSCVNKMVQVPSERCLLSPLGTVSDSFLPNKIIRIRKKIRYQQNRYMEKQREKSEKERQRRQLLHHCTTSNSYQSISDAPTQFSHVPSSNKRSGRKELGHLLRSGRQLKHERPKKGCNCCCCTRHFCHHKTEYTKGSRNPSCESFLP